MHVLTQLQMSKLYMNRKSLRSFQKFLKIKNYLVTHWTENASYKYNVALKSSAVIENMRLILIKCLLTKLTWLRWTQMLQLSSHDVFMFQSLCSTWIVLCRKVSKFNISLLKKITQRVPNQLKESNLKCSGLSVNMAAAITLLDTDMTLISFCNIIICQWLRFLPL